ncbi:MAG: type II toxin-antitoxin system RelE/ParE family toxin [Victivallales bacterium]|nr:type II toxin-antitoxin system RelE/ParE family toxin [Victivallales bacterium]
MQIIYHPKAEEEMIIAAKYYERQAEDLGFKFLDDLDKTVEEIINSPQTWITLVDDIKRHQFSHFPFAIIYRIVSSKIRVLAVMNLHREPNYWKKRI